MVFPTSFLIFLSKSNPSFQFPKKIQNTLIPSLLHSRFNSSCFAHEIAEPDEPNRNSAPINPGNSPGFLNLGFQERSKIPYNHKKSLASPSKTIQQDKRSKASNFQHKRLRRYARMLHNCAAKGSMREGKAIHGRLIIRGVELDSHLWVSLIDVYAKYGSLFYARKVLDLMPQRDVVSWTTLINGFVSEGCCNNGIGLYCEMQEEGVKPNEFTIATILKSCSLCFDYDFGSQVHAEAIKLGLFLDLFVGSALVDVYAKCEEMELAERMFSSMPVKNVVLCNALLNGYCETGDGEQFMNLFLWMTESKMNFSEFTLSTVLKGCANAEYAIQGQLVHSMATKVGCDLYGIVSCALVDMYSKCGLQYEAMEVFEKIKDPDVVAWSAIITCLDQQGQSWEAAQLFNAMRVSGVRPNEFTLASLVSVATHLGDLHHGESIHACICKYGFESEALVSNSLITMYMQNGSTQNGARVFEAMSHQDSDSWNSYLSGFNDCKYFEEVQGIFYKMLVEGVKPNMHTFAGVLRSCCGLLDLALGRQVHAHILKHSLDGNVFVGTALIDMYAKCGSLEGADIAFSRLIDRDLVTWTAIIASYAETDQAEKALIYFSQMQREGVNPNEFTVASCLSSCSYMATLDYGQLLHSIAIKAGFSRDMFVSSALVAIYGKSGCIKDAEAVFQG